MLRKIELIVTAFIICSFVILVVLSVAEIPFTFFWLMPIIRGLSVGISLATLKKLNRRPSLRDLFHRPCLEPCLQMALGLAFLIAGYFLV